MKYIILKIFIILNSVIQCFGDVRLLSFTLDNSPLFNKEEMENEFTEYAKKNNLNFKIDLETLSYEKPSDSYSFFKLFVEQSLKKHNNNTRDIYFYDSKYSNLYGPYLLNLLDKIPKEHIEKYDSKIINEECTFEDKHGEKLVGLPMSTSYEVLYSNKILLSKYKKPIPKTWDELIEICKHIMKEEDDSELICYNGLLDDSDQGLLSLYEFIYSCRDSYNSTFPNLQDESFINSIKMLRRIKDEVASNGIFSSNENFTFSKLLNGKAIFVKYWIVGEPFLSMPISPFYELSILPGLKEGISGSTILEYNIGITQHINEQKHKEAIEVVKFITSREYQKKLFMSGFASGMTELMDDEEACKVAKCDLLRRIQFTGEPHFIKNNLENTEKNIKNIFMIIYMMNKIVYQ